MESIMNNVNFIKNIDNLGRIVIPMDIRRKLQISTGDVLSITCNDKNIMLTKYSNLDSNSRVVDIVKYFVEIFNIKVMLTNKECVLYSNLVGVGAKLDSNTKLLVKNGNNIKYTNGSGYFGDRKIEGIYNMLPIITSEGIEGSIIVFGSEEDRSYEICILLSKLISLELNIT
jgi:transcriptional pleiotropic regulator of transition state genes